MIFINSNRLSLVLIILNLTLSKSYRKLKKKVGVFRVVCVCDNRNRRGLESWELGPSTLVNCGCFVHVRIDFTEIEVKGEENLAIAVVY